MASYTHYNYSLDPEWVEFSKSFTMAALPDDLALAKHTFNSRRVALFEKILSPVDGVLTKDVAVTTRDGTLSNCRVYYPSVTSSRKNPLPLYIHVHGGGYLFGSIETDDIPCRLYAVGAHCIVLNVEYRHTPEWTFPTPFHDVFDTIDWIITPQQAQKYGFNCENVILGGSSAGATIALAAAVREVEKNTNRLKGLNIACPSAAERSRFPKDLLKDGYTSFEQNASAPLLGVKQLEWLRTLLKGDSQSPYLSSLLLPNSVLEQLPPTVFHICGADPLRDGGLLLEDKLRSLGVKTRLHVYEGWPHCFWNQPQLKKAGEFRQNMVDDINYLFSIGEDNIA